MEAIQGGGEERRGKGEVGGGILGGGDGGGICKLPSINQNTSPQIGRISP